VTAAVAVIVAVRPDILLLTDFDWDATGAALTAFRARLSASGLDYPYTFAPRPNRGRASGFDLDGDGDRGGPADAIGWGRFTGEGGMALLSRFPPDTGSAHDFTGFVWRGLPASRIAEAGLPTAAEAALPLASGGHWDVPVSLPGGAVLHLLAYAAGPPVFRPEAMSRARNHDETAYWLRYLDGVLPFPPPPAPFVLLGNANADPEDGAGDRTAIRTLLADPRVSDPRPASEGGADAALPGKAGDPALDTAEWSGNPNVGDNLRVDYVLPSRDLAVIASGTYWPAEGQPGAAEARTASPHRLVWVDVE
jgi:hypothetical protein